MRIAHEFAAEHDGIGLTRRNDVVCLVGVGDEPYGVDGHFRRPFDALGERNLVTRSDRDRNSALDSA